MEKSLGDLIRKENVTLIAPLDGREITGVFRGNFRDEFGRNHVALENDGELNLLVTSPVNSPLGSQIRARAFRSEPALFQGKFVRAEGWQTKEIELDLSSGLEVQAGKNVHHFNVKDLATVTKKPTRVITPHKGIDYEGKFRGYNRTNDGYYGVIEGKDRVYIFKAKNLGIESGRAVKLRGVITIENHRIRSAHWEIKTLENERIKSQER